jgi:hypothetical protein
MGEDAMRRMLTRKLDPTLRYRSMLVMAAILVGAAMLGALVWAYVLYHDGYRREIVLLLAYSIAAGLGGLGLVKYARKRLADLP